jgi:hypothetical protein
VSRDKLERRASLLILKKTPILVLKRSSWRILYVYFTRLSKYPYSKQLFENVIIFLQVSQLSTLYGTRPFVTPHTSLLCTNCVQCTTSQPGFVLILFPIYF